MNFEIRWIQRILREHGIKYCPKCKEIKLLDEFSSHKGNAYTTTSGERRYYLSYDSKCRSCKALIGRVKRWDAKSERRIAGPLIDVSQPECMKEYEIRQLELKLVQPSREVVHSHGN